VTTRTAADGGAYGAAGTVAVAGTRRVWRALFRRRRRRIFTGTAGRGQEACTQESRQTVHRLLRGLSTPPTTSRVPAFRPEAKRRSAARVNELSQLACERTAASPVPRSQWGIAEEDARTLLSSACSERAGRHW
jgi:hypothetical protein